jgi:hypothetical protein
VGNQHCSHLKTELGLTNLLKWLWGGGRSSQAIILRFPGPHHAGLFNGFLRIVAVWFPQGECREKEQVKMSLNTEDQPVFYNVILEDTHHHFYATGQTHDFPVQCGRRLHKSVYTGHQDYFRYSWKLATTLMWIPGLVWQLYFILFIGSQVPSNSLCYQL